MIPIEQSLRDENFELREALGRLRVRVGDLESQNRDYIVAREAHDDLLKCYQHEQDQSGVLRAQVAELESALEMEIARATSLEEAEKIARDCKAQYHARRDALLDVTEERDQARERVMELEIQVAELQAKVP